jgi:hypothetical protein
VNALSGNLDRRGGTLVGRGVIDFAKFGVKNGLLVRDDRSRIGDFGSTNDAFPGGIGFSLPLHGMHGELLHRTRELIAGCECDHGCPTCVGPIGEAGPRAKTVALALLAALDVGAALPSGAPALDDVPF